MSHIVFLAIFSALMIPGLIAVLMMLPGVSYLFIIALLYEIVDRFAHLTWKELCVLAGLTVISITVDQLSGFIGARWGGARGKTFLYGIAGVVVGTIIMPIFGGLVGLFIGIFIGETMRRKNPEQALKAATGSAIGTATGILINMCIALFFIALFILFVLL
jgi:uncharacterized protein YqgC (DUF456 family)